MAVITNGTAVLGLGNIGRKSKPVMEGKGVLFKVFADIDVFDIEINETDPEKFVQIVKSLESTFGGINLEDIKAPECFYIERELRASLKIPVMHDDQHGTAIISSAALINALSLQKKKIEKVKFVINGAGAAAMACMKLYVTMGAKPENFIVFDRDGVLHKGRKDLEGDRFLFAVDKETTLEKAMVDADVFVGLSVGIPLPRDGEIDGKTTHRICNGKSRSRNFLRCSYRGTRRSHHGHGRSDFPNQVNNVLGFPFIFRGALDVRATQINEAMKLAAVKALADLAKTPVPDIVNMAYNEKTISFGPRYIIPKPFDPRLLSTVAPAVAKAAIDSNVAQIKIENWDTYSIELNKRLGLDNQLMRILASKAKSDPRRLVFAEADNIKILKVAQLLFDEGVAYPILLGNKERRKATATANNIDIEEFPIVDPRSEEHDERRKKYTEIFFQKRQRRGFNKHESNKIMRDRNYFGCMMVETGEADAMISGLTKNYPDTIRPAIEIIGTEEGVKKIAGMYLMLTKKGPLFWQILR